MSEISSAISLEYLTMPGIQIIPSSIFSTVSSTTSLQSQEPDNWLGNHAVPTPPPKVMPTDAAGSASLSAQYASIMSKYPAHTSFGTVITRPVLADIATNTPVARGASNPAPGLWFEQSQDSYLQCDDCAKQFGIVVAALVGMAVVTLLICKLAKCVNRRAERRALAEAAGSPSTNFDTWVRNADSSGDEPKAVLPTYQQVAAEYHTDPLPPYQRTMFEAAMGYLSPYHQAIQPNPLTEPGHTHHHHHA